MIEKIIPEKVAVIYNLPDKNISCRGKRCRDAEMIEKSLKNLGYKVERISIGNNFNEFLKTLIHKSPDYVFNLCEEIKNNSWGEIYVAGLLELLKIPYTGSDPYSLTIVLNKAWTKDILIDAGVCVPKYQVFNTENSVLKDDLSFPLIIKPLCEDGSIGICSNSIVRDKKAFKKQIAIKLKEFNGPAIIEEYLDGREFNMSILGNSRDIRIFPISEIDYSNMPDAIPRICSYKAKWDENSLEFRTSIPVCPANISAVLKRDLEEVANKVYKAVKGRDYCRIDIRLDKNLIPHVIDVNLNPCISYNSGYVRSAKEYGFDYKNLIGEIFACCKSRYKNEGQNIYKRIEIRRQTADRRHNLANR